MFSIYTSLYHVEKHNFPWQESIDNFVKFIEDDGELVIAINKSEDNTLNIIKNYVEKYKNVKIIETNFSYSDIEMDGKIKNAALQATTKDLKIQMDADEYVPLTQRQKWIEYGDELLKSPIECLMIPTLDLYGSKDRIKSNSQIGLKFRMHKKGLSRGVWKEARRGNHINTSMSDTCELLRQDGNLAYSQSVIPSIYLNPLFCSSLKDYIFTVHLGYLSMEHRININNKLWADHWQLRSGHQENVATKIEELANEPTIYHNLPIE